MPFIRKSVYVQDSATGFVPLTTPAYHDHIDSITNSSNDPPTYTTAEDGLQSRIQQFLDDAQSTGQSLPILVYPVEALDTATYQRQAIVRTYFSAIRSKNDELVAALLDSGLVTTETVNEDGRTPLLAAVEAGNIRTVQQLMDFDAAVDAYGTTVGMPVPLYVYKKQDRPNMTHRTPLQLAAETGNLMLLKLLVETYGADESLIAPDGELALRLAARNGHREIVAYLPSRRGGGFRRWKAKHRTAMRRIRRAGSGIYHFLRFLLWEIPKFVVWSVPKHVIVKPAMKSVQWLYEHRQEIPALMIKWLEDVWEALRKVPRGLWRMIKAIPAATRDAAKGVWKGVKRIPDIAERICNFLWALIGRIPRAGKIGLIWLWKGLKSAGKGVLDVFSKLVSFLHTGFLVLIGFVLNVTFQDVWNGFKALMQTLVVDGPKRIWNWICKFGKVMEKVFTTMFGCIGWLIWQLIKGIIQGCLYVPKRILLILSAMGSSMTKGFEEVLIWINPKRQ